MVGAVSATLWLIGSLATAGEMIHLKRGSVDPTHTESINKVMPSQMTLQEAMSTKYFIVQFSEVITEADKAFIAEKGAEILRYIPEDALIVKASPESVAHWQEENKSVRAVIPYLHGFRMSEDLEPASVFSQFKRAKVSIKLFAEKDLEATLSAIENISGVEVLDAGGKVIYAETLLSAVEALAKLDGVEWVQPLGQVKLMDMPLDELQMSALAEERGYDKTSGYETGTKVMNFEAAWDRGYTGQGQKVAMADTGLDSGDTKTLHSDFLIPFFTGFAFGLFTDSWEDPMGHGTHVAGSVLSNGTASGGLFLGGAYNAKMVAQGMWSKMLKGLTVPPQLERLFKHGYENGARVHTNSWGKDAAGAYDNFAQQADEYMWQHPDMLLVFAAGNSGVDENKDGRIDELSMGSPASAKNVLTVGASENYLLEGGIQRKLGELKGGDAWSVEPLAGDRLSDNANGIAAFSSRGPTADGRLKPDVVAPGTNIVSNCSQVEGASPLWGNYNQDYCYSGGTSMSTPLVAGAAAVVREYLANEHKMNEPSAALVKAVLMHSADDLYPGQYGEIGRQNGQELLVPGPNVDQGYGRVNMETATSPLANQYYTMVLDAPGVAQGESVSYAVSGGIHKVTLVYTDAPGSSASAKALVNNLDLEVKMNDGRILKSTSTLNNSEQIVAQQGEISEVVVRGVNIPQGRDGVLPFALVVSR